MNVLITNIWLRNYAGTEVFVRDLAIALNRRGIHVEVYSPELGKAAEDIHQAGIPIVNDPLALKKTPDIIHAHHFVPTMDALTRFPNTPALYFLHDRTHPADTPPRFSRIMHYVAVDYNCLDRLIIDNGIAPEDTSVLYNWVDTSRFPLRSHFSDRPRRALVFSNCARSDNWFQEIQKACKQMEIPLDGVGKDLGNPVRFPEDILVDYDIVFAKAKAAMEALATGAFVIACDFMGLGGAVTEKNFDHFRKYNFGMKTLTQPHDAALMVEEMEKYDPSTAETLALRIREEAAFDAYLDRLLTLYHQQIKKFKREGFRNNLHDLKTLEDYLPAKLLQWQNKEKNDIRNTNSLLQEKDQEIQRQIERHQAITNSLSYKLGRLITRPARWLYDLFSKS